MTDEADVYFYQAIIARASNAEDAFNALEEKFLDDRVHRFNDAVWHELTFDFIRRKRAHEGGPTNHQVVLADLIT